MSSNKCGRCGKPVYFAEEAIAAGSKWHKSCFCCKNCNKRLDSKTLTNKEGEIFCNSCYGKLFGPKGYGYGGGAGTLSMDTGKRGEVPSMAPKTGFPPSSSDHPVIGGCPRCGGRVYDAEKTMCIGQGWHKKCFTCHTCNKSLDSTNLLDHEQEIYCKTCHKKNFGPKGYGYGQGAGALVLTE